MTDEETPTLAEFIEWARMCGHYQVTDMYEHFLKFIDGDDDD